MVFYGTGNRERVRPYLPISLSPHQLHLIPTEETPLGSEGIPTP
ncbi:hypothetical protein [Moorena sp. SIOASIH]|nr:hypothetical protein [Moorena sp. SIOASIH]